MLGRIFGVAVALCCAGCACMGAAGQAAAETGPSAASPPAATPTLGQELRRLGAAAESLEHTLPSLTCKETAASEIFAGKKSRERDEFTATLRAKRGEDGVLDETFEVTTLNGKAPRRSVRFPFYVSGGLLCAGAAGLLPLLVDAWADRLQHCAGCGAACAMPGRGDAWVRAA